MFPDTIDIPHVHGRPILRVRFFYIIHGTTGNEQPIVTTPYGHIQGSYTTSYSKRVYSAFLSVPYAQPPVGDLRFREPQPLQKWYGIWEANFTTECTQLDHTAEVGGNFRGQEDCLYLNIFVPKRDPQEETLLDVFIDIHGGGFNFGSPHFYSGPKYIMDKNVIFITISYRVGPLGFLSTEDNVLPGNNGMKDQVAALKWVKENIEYFGGNPESITLTGLSAGGASVHYHYLSPLSKGLFKSGISVSGNALCPWTLQENARETTRILGAAVGCTQLASKNLVQCLKQRSARQIVENTRRFRPWLINPFSVFGLVVEKHGNNPFLPAHPYELMVNGKIQDLPWITSVTSHEGLYPAADFIMKDHYLPELEKRWEELAPYILHYEHTISPELKPIVATKIKQQYLKNNPISMETYQELIEIVSDRLFIADSEKAARLQAKTNKSPTYHYYFTYAGEEVSTFTKYYAYSEKRHGICHGDDIAFIMHNPLEPPTKLPKADEDMKNILLQVWTTFANTGSPKINGVEWTPVDANDQEPFNYLHIMSPEKVILKQTNELGHRTFWDSLPFQENQNLFLSVKKDEL